MFGTPGKLARDNADALATPHRTHRVGADDRRRADQRRGACSRRRLRDTFGRILDRSVTADFIVTDQSFQGLPPQVAENIGAARRAASGVTVPLRCFGTVDDDDKQFAAIDPVGVPRQLVDLDVTAGGFDERSTTTG